MKRRPRFRHRLEYALVRVALVMDRLLGARLSSALATLLGRFAYRVLRIRRNLVESQLRQAFPDRDDAWIRRTASRSYEHLARESLMLLRLARLGPEDVIRATDVDGLDTFQEALSRGRGLVVVTGHFGNWEIGGAAVAARGVPLDVIARRQANPLTDRLLNAARERLGMRVVDRWRATRESVRSLRAGRAVAFVADQDARHMGVFVPFLGRPASTYRGPAVLALRTGSPVFIGSAERQPDGRYRVRLRPIPLPPEQEDQDARVRDLTAAHVAALEATVRSAPDQYLWHHRRWKTAPPIGEIGNGAGGNEV